MSDSIKPFNWISNLSAITQGWSEGKQFKNPNLAPAMTIVDGCGPGVDEKLHVEDVKESAIIDSWNQRRANGN